jgi:hypothetical protein
LRHYLTARYCLFNIMVYFVIGLFSWGLYVYLGIYVPILFASSGAKAVLAALVFLPLWIVTMISYIRTVFRDPGSVPANCQVVRRTFFFSHRLPLLHRPLQDSMPYVLCVAYIHVDYIRAEIRL